MRHPDLPREIRARGGTVVISARELAGTRTPESTVVAGDADDGTDEHRH